MIHQIYTLTTSDTHITNAASDTAIATNMINNSFSCSPEYIRILAADSS